MKFKIALYSVLAIAGSSLITGCTSNMLSIPVSVNFGNPPKGGGPCGGKGLCSGVISSPSEVATAPGVATTFQLSPTDKNDLMMTFSMADLKKKQPEQVPNFTDGGTYNFDAPYDLTQLFSKLNLPAHSRIEPTTKSKVEIKGDVVTVHYSYTHE